LNRAAALTIFLQMFSAESDSSREERRIMSRLRQTRWLLPTVTSLLVACSDSPSDPGGVHPNFGMTVLPAPITARPGISSAPFTISIVPENGFSDSVTVQITGLPTGGTKTTPELPLRLGPSGSQSMTIKPAATTTPGEYVLSVAGTSGVLTHSIEVTMNVLPNP
jgi:hypothetical protein